MKQLILSLLLLSICFASSAQSYHIHQLELEKYDPETDTYTHLLNKTYDHDRYKAELRHYSIEGDFIGTILQKDVLEDLMLPEKAGRMRIWNASSTFAGFEKCTATIVQSLDKSIAIVMILNQYEHRLTYVLWKDKAK